MGGAPGGDTTRTPVLMFENGTMTNGVNVNVDCGVCHNPTSYDATKKVYNTDLKKWDYNPAEPDANNDHRVWKLSGLSAADQAKICYRCHMNSFRLKRGTPILDPVTLVPTAEDHHTNLNRASCLSCHPVEKESVKGDCSSCHNTINHKFPRGMTNVDISANDLPNRAVECTNCHSASRHTDLDGRNGAWTMAKHARLECQTCHNPELAVAASTIIYRKFRSSSPSDHYNIFASNIKPWQLFTVTDAENGTIHDIVPLQWRWFDGTQNSHGDGVFTTRTNSKAKLTPIKIIKTYQPDGTLKWAELQVSHGIKTKDKAIRDCNLCHVMHKDKLGL